MSDEPNPWFIGQQAGRIVRRAIINDEDVGAVSANF
jgi:hypothetical protein